MSVNAVEIRALHKRYGALEALRGIDFDIRRGEFFGLLGPNGAGKSTLISIMAGLTRATGGSVAILGHDTVRDYRAARRALGVVPQEIVFDPFFTVREVLEIQAGYFGIGADNRAWREELLAALKLTDKADTNMRALSGGMKRRVLIAQALVHRPQVVVLDEPTAGVDVELRQTLWTFIRRLHREGHTIVLTTHYLEEAENLCDRIAILNRGELVALDTKAALLARAIGSTLCVTTAAPVAPLPPFLAARLKSQSGNRLELTLDKEPDALSAVLQALQACHAQITEVHMEAPDLEEVFMELTAERTSA